MTKINEFTNEERESYVQHHILRKNALEKRIKELKENQGYDYKFDKAALLKGLEADLKFSISIIENKPMSWNDIWSKEK